MTAILQFRHPERLTRHIAYDRILEDKDLIDLYRGIEMALPGKISRTIQLTSCYRGEGSSTISRELAILATQALACRTLLIDINLAILAESDGAAGVHPRPLLDVAQGNATMEEALVQSSAESVWYACLTAGSDAAGLLPHLEKLRRILQPLREQFGLIIVNTPGVLIDPAIVPLGGLVDGAVLVLEAERTRAPAAKQAVRAIGNGGTKMIGVAFNKRRYHIPDRLYRFL